jgi:hypothetical protein
MAHGIVLKGIVKYYGRGKNILHTFGHTDLRRPLPDYRPSLKSRQRPLIIALKNAQRLISLMRRRRRRRDQHLKGPPLRKKRLM